MFTVAELNRCVTALAGDREDRERQGAARNMKKSPIHVAPVADAGSKTFQRTTPAKRDEHAHRLGGRHGF